MQANIANVRNLILEAIVRIPRRGCECKCALKGALVWRVARRMAKNVSQNLDVKAKLRRIPSFKVWSLDITPILKDKQFSTNASSDCWSFQWERSRHGGLQRSAGFHHWCASGLWGSVSVLFQYVRRASCRQDVLIWLTRRNTSAMLSKFHEMRLSQVRKCAHWRPIGYRGTVKANIELIERLGGKVAGWFLGWTWISQP